ncbi:hypothetical protein [Synechocystis sp. PCC 7509]|uniref:hypothetical protein n=1 Tax=Synechocystis sp. PCC 7509 TaxID=927677 RepID=UPI0002ABF7A4|nr:hypothetical protein [Synechocystis sp. PCC 7509]
MTNPPADRLERLELLVESNARSVQAIADRIGELTHLQEEAAEERGELRTATLRLAELTEGIANLTVSLDSDRPTILGRLSRIESKVDRLLQAENEN